MATQRNVPHLARQTAGRAKFRTTPPKSPKGMVVLDAVHQIQAESGERSGRALELQGRQVRLLLGGNQRHARS